MAKMLLLNIRFPFLQDDTHRYFHGSGELIVKLIMVLFFANILPVRYFILLAFFQLARLLF